MHVYSWSVDVKMIFLQQDSLIEEKLFGHEKFLRYCKESGKKFVAELDREDFIAYRAEYSLPREQIEQLKNQLDFRERSSARKNSSNQGDFFNLHKQKLPSNVLHRAGEELGEFLRNAALNHAPQVDLIIAAFEKFSASLTVKKLFRDLPAEIKNKRVNLFLRVCGLKRVFFVNLPDDLTFAELPEYLAKKNINFDADKLKNFTDELHFDVRAGAKKIVVSLFKDDREFAVVRRHAKGDTLEEIGRYFGVTRERIRQIELKSVDKFMKHCAIVRKIFCFIHALNDGKSLVTLDDMKNFMDGTDAEMLWFFTDKINLSIRGFQFDEELNAFIFVDGADFDDVKLIKNLPAVMEEDVFAEKVATLAREKRCPVELIELKLAKIYRRSGKIFHRDKLTLIFKCAYILKARFPNGYKIGDENCYSRFMRYLQEFFGEKTSLTKRALDALVSRIGVLCDRGKYIHPDFIHVSPKVMARVKKFIDSSARTAILYKEIFERLKPFFVGTQITNHYFLQGAIRLYDLPYTFRKDYLTKANEINIGKEIESFIAKRGTVSMREIKENFVSFKGYNMIFLIERCPEIIRVGDGIFMHASRLNLQDDDFKPIKKFLNQNCSTPVNSRVLFDLFFERFDEFMTRNDIQSHNKLFGVLRYMFRDEFNFSRSYISTTDLKGIDNKKVLLRLLEGTEKIELADVVAICDENGIHYTSRAYLIDILHPNFIRVDKLSLMRPESVGVTAEIISAVAQNIRSAVERNGGWQAAQTFEDYEWLPRLKTSWNSFLLESVMSLADDVPCIKAPSKSVNFSSTIFLSDEFAQDDYQSFLKKILSAEHDKEPFRTEKEIFAWLKTQGLCNKKLPKFLEDGRAFAVLGE